MGLPSMDCRKEIIEYLLTNSSSLTSGEIRELVISTPGFNPSDLKILITNGTWINFWKNTYVPDCIMPLITNK